MRVSHPIGMVKGVFLLDMGNEESSTSVISDMIIVYSLCVHVAYQNISLKLERYWADENAHYLGKSATSIMLKILNLDMHIKSFKNLLKLP